MVARGVDMFDCVMPTRLARHGVALTPDGPMHIKNQRWATDSRPIDPEGHPHVTQFPALTCGICLKPVKYSL